jgi:hypothetical protein
MSASCCLQAAEAKKTVLHSRDCVIRLELSRTGYVTLWRDPSKLASNNALKGFV